MQSSITAATENFSATTMGLVSRVGMENELLTFYGNNGEPAQGSSGTAHNSPASYPTSVVSSSSASPGPIRKFRETYGVEAPTKTTSAHTESYMESWMQNHHQWHHHYPSYSGSKSASSLASNASAISALSALSIDTNTDYEGVLVALPLPDFWPTPAPSTTPRDTEPMSCFSLQMAHYLALVSAKLNLPSEEERKEGIQLLYALSQSPQRLNYSQDISKLQLIVGQLFSLLARTPSTTAQEIHRVLRVLYELTYSTPALEAMRREFVQTRGGIIHILCTLLDPEAAHCKYTITILHTLFEQPLFGTHYRRCARSEIVVARLTSIVKSPACMFKHLALENIRVVVGSRKELKRFFAKQGGVELCLKMMQEYREEKILFRIANLLSSLLSSNDDDKSLVDHLVSLSGVEILSNFLEHGSPRLLRAVARCMASVSDSDVIASRKVDTSLARSIQMLGSTDMELVNLISGFLCNVQSKSPTGKVYLHDNKAIENFMRLLCVWSSAKPVLQEERVKLREMLDTVLMALSNLTANYHCVDNPAHYVESACRQILFSSCGEEGAPKVFLNLLVSDGHYLAARVLLLLVRIVENVSGAIVSFTNVYVPRVDVPRHQMNYVYHLHTLLFSSIEATRGENRSRDLNVLKRQGEKIKRILVLLGLFASESLSLRQIIALSTAYKNPVLLMPLLNNGDLEISLIRFLHRISANDVECLDGWRSEPKVEAILEQCSHSTETRLSTPAGEILNALRRRDYQLKFSEMQIDA